MYPFYIRWYLKIFPYFSLTRSVRDEKEPFWKASDDVDLGTTNTVNILARCGIGDILSFMTRLSAVKNEYPGRAIRFILGGHANIPFLMRNFLFRDPLVDEVVILNGYQTTSERRKKWVRRDMERMTRAKDSVLLDWLDLTPALAFPMDHPYHLRMTKEERRFAESFYKERGLNPKKTVLLHCLTLGGNASGFQTERFWPRHRYQAIIQKLKKAGWSVVLLGWREENFGFMEDREKVFFAHTRREDGFWRQLTVFEAASLIPLARGFIGTNSWTWEVAFRAKVPTVVFYLTTKHWIPIHAPDGVRRAVKTLHVETDREATPDAIFKRFQKLVKGVRRNM